MLSKQEGSLTGSTYAYLVPWKVESNQLNYLLLLSSKPARSLFQKKPTLPQIPAPFQKQGAIFSTHFQNILMKLIHFVFGIQTKTPQKCIILT